MTTMSTAFENTNNKVSKLIATFILSIPTMLTLLLSLILLGCNRPSTPTTQAVGLEQVPAVSTTASALQPPQQSTGSQSKTKPKPQANSQAKSQTKPQENQWRVIAPSDALATIRMPKKPRYIERTFPPVANKPPIKVHLHMATVNEGKITYSFGHHDLHEVPINAQTRDKALEGAVRGSVANVQGELLSDVTNIRYKKSLSIRSNCSRSKTTSRQCLGYENKPWHRRL